MARQKYLSELKSYIEAVDKDVTMILQSLQWDRKRLLETPEMVTCRFDQKHRIPADHRGVHEQQCLFRSQGYSKEDELLPDPPDPAVSTLVKLDNNDINKIIHEAAQLDPLFKREAPHGGPLPHSLSRLQHTYTTDERRAIHDAVVAAAPAAHDLAELALISPHESHHAPRAKSRAEVLAELRDARRRRTKYRTNNTKNYSNTLRDVITAQMELFGVQHNETNKTVTVKIENNDDRSTSYTKRDRRQSSSQRDHDIGNTRREHHSGRSNTESSRQSGSKHRNENNGKEYADRSNKRSRDGSYIKHQDDYRGDPDNRDSRHRDRGSKDKPRSYSRERRSKTDHHKYDNRYEKYSSNRCTESSSSGSKKYDQERHDNYSERHRRDRKHNDTIKVKEEPGEDGRRDHSTRYEHSRKRAKHH